MGLISLSDVIPGVQAGNSKEECVHKFSDRQDENDRKQSMLLSSKVTNNTVHLEDVAVSEIVAFFLFGDTRLKAKRNRFKYDRFALGRRKASVFNSG